MVDGKNSVPAKLAPKKKQIYDGDSPRGDRAKLLNSREFFPTSEENYHSYAK